MTRRGAIEFLPNKEEKFNLFEAKPSVSRFLGSDKLTLDGVYALLNVTDVVGGIPEERLRKEYIRAVRLEYALYSPLVLPTVEGGELTTYRTPTRGFYFYGGFMQDDQVYGVRTVTRRDAYLGTRFEGPGAYDLTLQGTLYTSRTTYVEPNDLVPVVRVDPAHRPRATAPRWWCSAVLSIPTRRLVYPRPRGLCSGHGEPGVPRDARPGALGAQGLRELSGGREGWLKLFGTGIGGTALLMTVGYDYQYFYRIVKSVHMAHASLRIGWGDL